VATTTNEKTEPVHMLDSSSVYAETSLNGSCL